MPNNFRHIGLIHLMMPNAKIIDVRREPMACCFSNLKQLFAGGQEFTYGIEFYNTERCVRTASSEQVRRPIFREGLLQWRNYEPWLGSLKDALGDALIRYRD
jgi:sulfotransferase family protein